jgi:hypothetical protein
MIPTDWSAIKAAVDIVEIARRYVELQRRGRRADGPRAQPLAPTPAQPAPR